MLLQYSIGNNFKNIRAILIKTKKWFLYTHHHNLNTKFSLEKLLLIPFLSACTMKYSQICCLL